MAQIKKSASYILTIMCVLAVIRYGYTQEVPNPRDTATASVAPAAIPETPIPGHEVKTSIVEPIEVYNRVMIIPVENIDWKTDVFWLYSTFCGPDAFCDVSNYNGSVVRAFGVQCPQCSCDDDCGYYDDCCVDKAVVTSYDSSMTSCRDINPLKCLGNLKTDNIYMFDQCPADFAGTEIDQLCRYLNTSIDFSNLPVTSLERKRTYYNEFCAQCHGLISHKYVHWSANFTCEYDLTPTDVYYDTCCFTSVTPPVEKSELKTCEPQSVTRSCKTDVYNSETSAYLQRMCDRFTALVAEGEEEGGTIYGNVYCLACNQDPREYGEGIEWDPGYGFELGNSIEDGDMGPALDAVVVGRNPPPGDTVKSHDVITTPTCDDRANIYDVFEGECRQVQCDWQRKFDGENCSRKFNGSRLFTYMMNYDLDIKSVSKLTSLVKTYYENTWMIFNQIRPNVVVARVWNVVVKGSANRSTHNLVTYEFNVEQEVVVNQSQKYVSKNENLLYVSYSAGLEYMNGNTLVRIPYRSIHHHASHTDKIVLTNGVRYPYVTYFPDAVKTRPNDSSITEIMCFQISIPKSSYHKSFMKIKLDISELQRINSDINSGKIAILNSTDENNRTIFRFEAITREYILSDTYLKHQKIKYILTVVLCSISIIGLGLTFVTYSLITELRTAPGYNTMALVLHLLLAQLLFLTAARRYPGESDGVCAFFGALIHYLWLCAFFWMITCAFHMHSVFTQFRPPRWTTKRFLCYILAANGIPVVMVAACVIYHVTQAPYTYTGYGGQICYLSESRDIMLVFIIAPLAVMILANSIFFGRTVYYIRKISENASATLNKSDRNHVGVYFKLSILLGLTWALGFVMYITTLQVFAYLFIIANGCQGLLVFIGYCCNARIYKSYRKLITGREEKEAISVTKVTEVESTVGTGLVGNANGDTDV